MRALARNDPAALDGFWKYVETKHTPLVEDLPNDPHNALYTFLVHGDAKDDVINVRLGAGFPMRTPYHTDTFQRLGTTNVWYTSYVLPKASLITYRIRVPKGLLPSPSSQTMFTIDGIQYEHFLDPLNPRVFGENDEHIDAPLSYCIGPEAGENPYAGQHGGVPKGKLQTFDLDSVALGSKRTVTIYTPSTYDRTGKANAFILMFDSESYISVILAPTILDNLIAQGVIPPTVVAFVHSHGTRDSDLPPNAGFQDFIGSELVPWMRKRYRISRNPKLNVVGGVSLGGLAAAYTAFMYPKIFGNVLSESGSFWWSPNYEREVLPSPNAGWMVKQFAEAAPKPIRFYITAGVWESPGALSATRILHSVLVGKGNSVIYREMVGGHDPLNFQQSLPDGLIALLAVRHVDEK